MNTYNQILNRVNSKKASFVILIDTENISTDKLPIFVTKCVESEVDFIFIGGSLLLDMQFDQKIKTIKKFAESIPVIIFPGALNQLSGSADAVLFLSLISGRNPEHLIGNQVLAAPMIKKLSLEAISTAYMLIESGQTTSVEFISGTNPIPRDKADIAIAHAMAAELLGFKLIYLEAGSGAEKTVPDEMIRKVSHATKVPLIVGGGIKSPESANQKVSAGADIIVIGNHFEKNNDSVFLKEFSLAIHSKS